MGARCGIRAPRELERIVAHAVKKGWIESKHVNEQSAIAWEVLSLPRTLSELWLVLKLTAEGFVADDAWSRGASIAYFTLFSAAPVLLVIIAIAGMTSGQDAAQGAIVDELSGLMGRETAEATQVMVRSASDRMTGKLASLIGLVTILVAITGVFGELQSALNAVWNVVPRRSTTSRLLRARLVCLGLVAAVGFVLMVSLSVSAVMTALLTLLHGVFPVLEVVLGIVDILVSILMVGAMFAAMYKVLPDTPVSWRDVGIGALVATLLFTGGKYLIAVYIGSSNVASSFGAAGALIVLLLWIFYSAQIFLLGAEFGRAWAQVWASRRPNVRPSAP
jgi:membrane protein